MITQVVPQGGRGAFRFHQMQPVVWTIDEVYPMSYDGTGRQEKIYQVSAYTTRYRSWGGTWTPWNTGRPWEQGHIEIFNGRVTLPDPGAHTQAAHMAEYRVRVKDLVESVTLQILTPA